MQKKFTNKKILIIVIFVLILLFGVTAAYLRLGSDAIAGKTEELPEISVNGDSGFSTTGNDGTTIKAVTGFVFRSDSLEQTVEFENEATNKYVMTIGIYLRDGTELYESDYLNPGDKLDKITLTQPLDAGIYSNAMLAYRLYSCDDSHTAVSQCEFPIEIRCVK